VRRPNQRGNGAVRNRYTLTNSEVHTGSLPARQDARKIDHRMDQNPVRAGTSQHTVAWELVSGMRLGILNRFVTYPKKVQELCWYPATDIILHGDQIGAL
jgi:hypothetical protein